MKIPFLLGRMAFGGFFLYNGINHFRSLRSMSAYAGAKKVPLAGAAVAATGALLATGGASIVLGVKPKYGVLAILTFLGGVSPVMHDFWNEQDPGARNTNLIHFSKNMALAGAALALLGVEEPWPASIPLAHQSCRQPSIELRDRVPLAA
jgi:putative oxidoreductase